MRNKVTWGSLLILVGGYIGYLGIQMITDTESGVSTMPMKTSVIYCVLMCAAGLAVVIYGLRTLLQGRKEQEELLSEDDSEDETEKDTEEDNK